MDGARGVARGTGKAIAQAKPRGGELYDNLETAGKQSARGMVWCQSSPLASVGRSGAPSVEPPEVAEEVAVELVEIAEDGLELLEAGLG